MLAFAAPLQGMRLKYGVKYHAINETKELALTSGKEREFRFGSGKQNLLVKVVAELLPSRD